MPFNPEQPCGTAFHDLDAAAQVPLTTRNMSAQVSDRAFMISVGACRLRARGPQAGPPERDAPIRAAPRAPPHAHQLCAYAATVDHSEPVFMFAESAVQIVGEDGEELLAAYCRAQPAGFNVPGTGR